MWRCVVNMNPSWEGGKWRASPALVGSMEPGHLSEQARVCSSDVPCPSSHRSAQDHMSWQPTTPRTPEPHKQRPVITTPLWGNMQNTECQSGPWPQDSGTWVWPFPYGSFSGNNWVACFPICINQSTFQLGTEAFMHTAQRSAWAGEGKTWLRNQHPVLTTSLSRKPLLCSDGTEVPVSTEPFVPFSNVYCSFLETYWANQISEC